MSALLIVPLLGNPGICYAHTHAGEPADHDSRPHVHLHQHRGHHHQHKRGSHAHSRQRQAEPSVGRLAGANHDEDAIYLAPCIAFATSTKAPQVTSTQSTAAPPIALDRWALGSKLALRAALHPPPTQSTRHPIYLRVLSLRI